jgi:hypothetical protein
VAKVDEGELLALIKDRYDYIDGNFYNQRTLNSRALNGQMAGTENPARRPGDSATWRLRIQGKQYLESHLVWLWHHGRLPKADLEHLDGDQLNSAIENLREYDHRQRLSARRTNKSTYPGVSWDRQTEKWRATIWVDKKAIQLGRFANLGEAIEARKAAEIKHGRAPE